MYYFILAVLFLIATSLSAGIVGMCFVPAVAIRRFRCQASSCLNPAVCASCVSATCRSQRRLWR